MPRTPKTLLVAVRAISALALLLGLLVWAGHPVPWRGAHIALGVVLGGTLLALGAVVARAAGRPRALLVAGGWTILLVGYGVWHPRFLPGGVHWVAQLLHVLLGLATLGVAERVARGRPAAR